MTQQNQQQVTPMETLMQGIEQTRVLLNERIDDVLFWWLRYKERTGVKLALRFLHKSSEKSEDNSENDERPIFTVITSDKHDIALRNQWTGNCNFWDVTYKKGDEEMHTHFKTVDVDTFNNWYATADNMFVITINKEI